MFILARDHGDPPRETKAEVIVSIFGTLITVVTEAPTSETFEYTNSAEEETKTNPDYYFQSITTAPSNIYTFSSFPSPSPVPVPPTVSVLPHVNNTSASTEQLWTTLETKPTSAETRPVPYEWPRTTLTTSGTTSSVVSSTSPPLRLAPVFNPAQITVTADENESDIEIAKVS
ncbi:hypothetical protein COOONC_21647 [Cooperia oncophora]